MNTGSIILISGPCGSGKTTVSRLLAARSQGPSVHMHTDDFYAYIRKGYIPPWEEGSGGQNETVVQAAAACARAYAAGGYQTFVDGVIGPWFLEPWQSLARQSLDVRYIVLLPGEDTAVHRAMTRPQKEEPSLTEEVVRKMWGMFRECQAYGLDTSGQSPEESAALLEARLRAGEFQL